METRSRTRYLLRGAAVLAALGALTAPATASAAVKAPVITAVTPKSVSVGGTLLIRGKYFTRGKGSNRVLFRGTNGKSLFVRSALSTAKRMTVVIPSKLGRLLAQRNGVAVATRFRLRVLTHRMSRRFTATANSPLVAPAPPKPVAPVAPVAPVGPATSTPVPPCPVAGDDDGDGLPSSLELAIGTNPCAADSDGDGVTDGFEYRSAVDLNNDDYRHPTQSLPYPGKRPYANPLDPSDAGTDYDGDWLPLGTEYRLWRYSVAHGASPSLDSLTYSDGLKYSIYTRDSLGRRIPALPAAGYDKQADFENWLTTSGYGTIVWPHSVTPVSLLDVDQSGVVDPSAIHNGNLYLHAETSYLDVHGATSAQAPDGFLSDDERDEDADGLSNVDEDSGQMTSAWWKGVYSRETPFRITYAGTDPADPDTDGDTVRDGADDQDHDDVPNFDELSRNMASGRLFDDPDLDVHSGDPSTPAGRVNPFNPCLPYPDSRTCPSFIPLGGNAWAPFDGLPNGDDPDYLVLN